MSIDEVSREAGQGDHEDHRRFLAQCATTFSGRANQERTKLLGRFGNLNLQQDR
jgi:hypothetical protein